MSKILNEIRKPEDGVIINPKYSLFYKVIGRPYVFIQIIDI
jgi:hypothetical protein